MLVCDIILNTLIILYPHHNLYRRLYKYKNEHFNKSVLEGKCS